MHLPDDIALRFAAQAAGEPPDLDALSAAERERLAAFGSAKRRCEFALGRTAARHLLAERLAVAPPEVPLITAPDGAPEVADGPWHVSIAHAATVAGVQAVAAVGSRPLGVDLEVIRPRRPDLHRFLLHPDEDGLLERLPFGHDAAQILTWTLKEAVLKAMRTGLRCSPKKVRLAVEVEGVAAARVEGGGAWGLRYAERAGCFVAVAFEE